MDLNSGSQYLALLNQAQDSYANVMNGYQVALQGQEAAQQNIQTGYNQLYGQVATTLGYGGTPWGVAAPAAQAIADLYKQQQGTTTQGLINSGLGNTTVLGAMQRGNALDAAKAYGSLGAQLAQTYAGYQSNLGQAGLNYANQAVQQNTALQNAQLGYQSGLQQTLAQNANKTQPFGPSGTPSVSDPGIPAGLSAGNYDRTGGGGGGGGVPQLGPNTIPSGPQVQTSPDYTGMLATPGLSAYGMSPQAYVNQQTGQSIYDPSTFGAAGQVDYGAGAGAGQGAMSPFNDSGGYGQPGGFGSPADLGGSSSGGGYSYDPNAQASIQGDGTPTYSGSYA